MNQRHAPQAFSDMVDLLAEHGYNVAEVDFSANPERPCKFEVDMAVLFEDGENE